MDVPIDRYSIVQLFPYFSLNNEIEESVGNLFCAFRVAESKKPKIFKNGRSYRPLFNCIAFSLFFFKQRDREKCWEPFFVRFEQLNPKNQKFLKTDVPIDRYSIVQLFPYFSLNNEIEESVGNLFCAFRVAESKKPKIFKNGRSYRPLFNCIAFSLFFFKQRDRGKQWRSQPEFQGGGAKLKI